MPRMACIHVPDSRSKKTTGSGFLHEARADLLGSVRRTGRRAFAEQVFGVDPVERVALCAELADHLDFIATRGQSRLHLVATERTQHRGDPLATATAAEGQWPRVDQARR